MALKATFGPLAAALVLFSSGCARRFALTPDDLARVQAEAGVEPLRVYTNRRLVSVYRGSAVDERYAVDRKITEASRTARKKVVTKRNDAGLILSVEQLNGNPLLWITFDPRCVEPECAHGFVETEDGRYRLLSVPPRPGFGAPKTYRPIIWKKRRLDKGKLASLAEANEVYLVKKRGGKILTVHLDIIKSVDRHTHTQTEHSQGIK